MIKLIICCMHLKFYVTPTHLEAIKEDRIVVVAVRYLIRMLLYRSKFFNAIPVPRTTALRGSSAM